MAYCTNCGAPLDDAARFCPRCGRPVGPIAGPSLSTSDLAIPRHIAGALAYLVIPAIVFLLIAPYRNDRFVRFHSFQALAFTVISMIPRIVIYVPVAGIFLWPILEVTLFIVWVILLVKALQGNEFKLPLIGEWAEDQAVRTA